jgi:hypothetical protein
MTELNNVMVSDKNGSPNAPGNPRMSAFRSIYHFIASAKLAIGLLIAIFVCCAVGVTFLRGPRADVLIFRAIWFNGLLVLLAVNVAFCFFGRTWGRKLTFVSFGMILFHVSFIMMLGGNIYNSLCFFKGTMRLTEGETLSNRQLENYDSVERGRFFNRANLKGETTLIKMHENYKVDSSGKGVGYEISVGDGPVKKRGVSYVLENLDYNGFRYMKEKEGYSPLIVLSDKNGRELYGFYVPLQSLEQKNGAYLYTTGTKEGPGDFPFPQPPMKPLFGLQFAYRPDLNEDRSGMIFFHVWPLSANIRQGQEEKPFAEGKAAVGEKFRAGDYYIEAREVRYWASMQVLYDPGQWIILSGFWAGFSGLMLTWSGRLWRHSQDRPSDLPDSDTSAQGHSL